MENFDFEDIILEPRICIANSRSFCDTRFRFFEDGTQFTLPIIPANMECVIDSSLAEKLAQCECFYILHRFLKDEEILRFLKKMNNDNLLTSISIGVNEESYELLKKILKQNLKVDFITIDIAHGHSLKTKRMIEFLKQNLSTTKIIAGNISTIEGALDLEEWGAHILKIGIGPGSACTTYPSTGFGSKGIQASVIYKCANVVKIPIIADGGISCPGDIAKALVLGATAVMVGGLLSGFSDSPGEIIETEGMLYKRFWGSASSYQSRKRDRIEGKMRLIPLKDKSFFSELGYLKECLQSSISYGGGTQLKDLNKVKFIFKK